MNPAGRGCCHGSSRCHIVPGALPSWGSAELLIPSRSDQKLPVFRRFLAGKEKCTRLLRRRFFFLHSGHAERSVLVSCGYCDRIPDQGLRDNRNLFLAVLELEV